MDNNGSLEALAKDFWVSLNCYPTAHLHGIRKALYAFIIERGRHWFRDPFMLNVYFTSHALYFSTGSEPWQFVHRKWMNSEWDCRLHEKTLGGCARGCCWHHRAGNRSMASPQRPMSKHQSKNALSGRSVTVVPNTFYTSDLKPRAYSTLPQEVRPTKGQSHTQGILRLTIEPISPRVHSQACDGLPSLDYCCAFLGNCKKAGASLLLLLHISWFLDSYSLLFFFLPQIISPGSSANFQGCCP